MSVAGIIFSNIHDSNIADLTRLRTMASVPFGCRYRLIDFTLSNMVNSGITNVYVITHYNYHSLMDHIGSGKDWDLARARGGIKILPPFISAFANNVNVLYKTRLEALKSINHAISNIKDDYVVLSDCDVICNIDLNEIISDHINSGADMTIAVKRMYLTPDSARINIIYKTDENGTIHDVESYPANFEGEADVSLNIVVMSRRYLQTMVLDAIAHDYVSMNRDIIARNVRHSYFRVYRYDGYFAVISSMQDYFKHSMELISDASVRRELFGVKNRPIYTKIRNSAPTRYIGDASVRNSLVADGCVIEGRVENSMLFRGVRIGKNTTVKNSILFQDTYTGENVSLNCVLTDKDVVIRDNVNLSGHTSMPIYVEKGRMI
ncbi:MAG TPA: glucose-1-phosphate adenylyltransferase subunit GlgD [Bacillota bacterium]|nr:glucose-1-phosphate adenylyltransferase subunit GlgD [Bacillota bacterium]HPU17043.1 glucose-1-phosphate adenylyltransferase subunit GlgD [Bacillota bacterium]